MKKLSKNSTIMNKPSFKPFLTLIIQEYSKKKSKKGDDDNVDFSGGKLETVRTIEIVVEETKKEEIQNIEKNNVIQNKKFIEDFLIG